MNDSYLDGLLDELVRPQAQESWDDVLHRARRSQRRYVALVAVVGVLILAPATWATVNAFSGIKHAINGNMPTAKIARRTFTLIRISSIDSHYAAARTHDETHAYQPNALWILRRNLSGSRWHVVFVSDGQPPWCGEVPKAVEQELIGNTYCLPLEALGRDGYGVRPRVIVPSKDGSEVLGGPGGSFTGHHLVPGNLTWKTYTGRQAKASGAVWLDDCKPTCAAGTFTSHPAEVRLFGPMKFRFTRLSYVFTEHGQKRVETFRLSHDHWTRG